MCHHMAWPRPSTPPPASVLSSAACRCKGKQDFTLSLFETHCNSNYKKPAEFLFLASHNLSLKELVQLVQVRRRAANGSAVPMCVLLRACHQRTHAG